MDNQSIQNESQRASRRRIVKTTIKYQAMENEYLKYYMKKKDKLYNSDKKQV